jgi:hypothetical protein
MNFKQWFRRREDWLLFIAIWMFVVSLFTPSEFLILTEVVSVIFFGVLSLYYWGIESSIFPLVVWRGLGILNAIMFLIHSILLFLVIFN